jgi:hypothetical protein
MRIFYAADNRPAAGLAESYIWHYNLYLPLCDLGHEVISFEYDLNPHFAHADLTSAANRKFNEAYRPRLEAELLRQIGEAHRQRPIDIFFSYFYASFVRPEVIQEIRRMGILSVNWYCNASYQFHLIEEIAPAYDFCLVPEKFRLGDYRRVGANPIYCQEAANPNIYKPYPLPREFDVVFIGGKYGDRPQYIRYLLDADISVLVWGPGWQQPMRVSQPTSPPSPVLRLAKLRTVEGWRRVGRKAQHWLGLLPPPDPPVTLPPAICGPPLSDEDMIKMYSRAKISLGFSSCGDTHRTRQRILQVHLRDFEAPMSGAFYMVEYMEELEEFFEIGKEIVCYNNKVDLAEKIKYYLSHDTEREKIRQAGYRRAVNEHSWQKRFQEAFRQMGIS